MDFINETNVKLKDATKRPESIMNKITEKPHGLFYRTESYTKMSLITNVSIDTMTTESTSIILDWVFDGNISTTEDTYFPEMFPTTDIENVTEITLSTNSTPPDVTPKISGGSCGCNVLHKTCDINCCCDSDCSDAEVDLFSQNCVVTCVGQNGLLRSCDSSECGNKMPSSFLENLFCISKTNLPGKRLTEIQFDEAAVYRYPRWRTSDRQQAIHELGVYKYNDPVWLGNGDSTFHADIPMSVGNNYCSDKRSLRFLKNENIKCIVKLQDLHMWQAMKNTNASVLSVGATLPNTTKNETRCFRTNWTLLICDEGCRSYNRSQDEPHCTDDYCANIATTVQYQFHYYGSRITKAVLKLKVRRVAMQYPFITQHVVVKFYLSNDSIEDIVQLSGDPGYNWASPVIVSSARGNHSWHFFNDGKRILTYPDNRNGECIYTNVTYKIVKFGQNKRSKCRFHIPKVNVTNGTSACRFIQKEIFRILGLNATLHVSPYGNPGRGADWLRLQVDEGYTHGVVRNSELTCFDIVTRIGYIIGYADIPAGGSKILHATVEGTAQNVTFDVEDTRTAVTVDATFVELSKTRLEFAGAPPLGIGLPTTFFLPNGGGARGATRLIAFLCPLIASRQ